MTPGALWLKLRNKFGHGWRVMWYRDVVRPRILATPPIEETTDGTCEIHALTSMRDWLNLVWGLKSFYLSSGRRFALCIHEDGSLSDSQTAILRQHFPAGRLVRRADADARLANVLANFPRCLAFRNSNSLAPKIFDFPAYLAADRMLVFDSDVLFFDRPAALLSALADKGFTRNTLNRDWDDGYSIDPQKTSLDFSLPARINSGLGLIHRASIRYDWIEEFLALPNILRRPHTIEQTLFALCSARFGFEMLPTEYDVHLGPTRSSVPCRHYTGPARHLMYGEGMRRLVRGGFLRDLAAA